LNFPFTEKHEQRDLDLAEINSVINGSKVPIGMFCPNSFIARAVIESAISVGATIPDDVALVAVNDDPLLCETTDPPLSAIVQDSIGIGFSAMEALVAKLNGDQVSNQSLSPKRVSARRSSDVLMVGNEVVENALRHIRDNAHREMEISQIAEQVGVSRRTLEKKFRETIDSSPHQELLRMRMDLAKSLLIESNLSITQIALSSGFGSSQVFSTVFKKQSGVTPSQFRLKEA
jgi:LacI family transcriptional regulator